MGRQRLTRQRLTHFVKFLEILEKLENIYLKKIQNIYNLEYIIFQSIFIAIGTCKPIESVY